MAALDHAGAQLLAQAVEAYRQALLVRTHEQLPQQWATTQYNLGNVLTEQGTRTEGQAGAQFFTEAIQAYRQAREVYTYEYFPRYWDITRWNEARALVLSSSYREAAEAFSEILAKNPDDENAFSSLVALLNDHIFDPARALVVNREWLVRHPEDPFVRLAEIEALFASGAFAACEEKAATLLATAGLSARRRTMLLGYEVAAGCAAGSSVAPIPWASLLDEVAAQPADFTTSWDFLVTLHSLHERPNLPHRDWLVRFFQTLEAKDRESLLQGLRALQTEITIPQGQ